MIYEIPSNQQSMDHKLQPKPYFYSPHPEQRAIYKKASDDGIYLLASATGAIPETVRLRSTANMDKPPTYIGKLRTTPSFLDTQSATQSLFDFDSLYPSFQI